MKATEFCYWLQGAFEVHGIETALSVDKVKKIRDHLNMVFLHEIDPSYPKNQQNALNAAHTGNVPEQNNHIPSGDVLLRC